MLLPSQLFSVAHTGSRFVSPYGTKIDNLFRSRQEAAIISGGSLPLEPLQGQASVGGKAVAGIFNPQPQMPQNSGLYQDGPSRQFEQDSSRVQRDITTYVTQEPAAAISFMSRTFSGGDNQVTPERAEQQQQVSENMQMQQSMLHQAQRAMDGRSETDTPRFQDTDMDDLLGLSNKKKNDRRGSAPDDDSSDDDYDIFGGANMLGRKFGMRSQSQKKRAPNQQTSAEPQKQQEHVEQHINTRNVEKQVFKQIERPSYAHGSENEEVKFQARNAEQTSFAERNNFKIGEINKVLNEDPDKFKESVADQQNYEMLLEQNDQLQRRVNFATQDLKRSLEETMAKINREDTVLHPRELQRISEVQRQLQELHIELSDSQFDLNIVEQFRSGVPIDQIKQLVQRAQLQEGVGLGNLGAGGEDDQGALNVAHESMSAEQIHKNLGQEEVEKVMGSAFLRQLQANFLRADQIRDNQDQIMDLQAHMDNYQSAQPDEDSVVIKPDAADLQRRIQQTLKTMADHTEAYKIKQNRQNPDSENNQNMSKLTRNIAAGVEAFNRSILKALAVEEEETSESYGLFQRKMDMLSKTGGAPPNPTNESKKKRDSSDEDNAAMQAPSSSDSDSDADDKQYRFAKKFKQFQRAGKQDPPMSNNDRRQQYEPKKFKDESLTSEIAQMQKRVKAQEFDPRRHANQLDRLKALGTQKALQSQDHVRQYIDLDQKFKDSNQQPSIAATRAHYSAAVAQAEQFNNFNQLMDGMGRQNNARAQGLTSDGINQVNILFQEQYQKFEADRSQVQASALSAIMTLRDQTASEQKQRNAEEASEFVTRLDDLFKEQKASVLEAADLLYSDYGEKFAGPSNHLMNDYEQRVSQLHESVEDLRQKSTDLGPKFEELFDHITTVAQKHINEQSMQVSPEESQKLRDTVDRAEKLLAEQTETIKQQNQEQDRNIKRLDQLMGAFSNNDLNVKAPEVLDDSTISLRLLQTVTAENYGKMTSALEDLSQKMQLDRNYSKFSEDFGKTITKAVGVIDDVTRRSGSQMGEQTEQLQSMRDQVVKEMGSAMKDRIINFTDPTRSEEENSIYARVGQLLDVYENSKQTQNLATAQQCVKLMQDMRDEQTEHLQRISEAGAAANNVLSEARTKHSNSEGNSSGSSALTVTSIDNFLETSNRVSNGLGHTFLQGALPGIAAHNTQVAEAIINSVVLSHMLQGRVWQLNHSGQDTSPKIDEATQALYTTIQTNQFDAALQSAEQENLFSHLKEKCGFTSKGARSIIYRSIMDLIALGRATPSLTQAMKTFIVDYTQQNIGTKALAEQLGETDKTLSVVGEKFDSLNSALTQRLQLTMEDQNLRQVPENAFNQGAALFASVEPSIKTSIENTVCKAISDQSTQLGHVVINQIYQNTQQEVAVYGKQFATQVLTEMSNDTTKLNYISNMLYTQISNLVKYAPTQTQAPNDQLLYGSQGLTQDEKYTEAAIHETQITQARRERQTGIIVSVLGFLLNYDDNAVSGKNSTGALNNFYDQHREMVQLGALGAVTATETNLYTNMLMATMGPAYRNKALQLLRTYRLDEDLQDELDQRLDELTSSSSELKWAPDVVTGLSVSLGELTTGVQALQHNGSVDDKVYQNFTTLLQQALRQHTNTNLSTADSLEAIPRIVQALSQKILNGQTGDDVTALQNANAIPRLYWVASLGLKSATDSTVKTPHATKMLQLSNSVLDILNMLKTGQFLQNGTQLGLVSNIDQLDNILQYHGAGAHSSQALEHRSSRATKLAAMGTPTQQLQSLVLQFMGEHAKRALLYMSNKIENYAPFNLINSELQAAIPTVYSGKLPQTIINQLLPVLFEKVHKKFSLSVLEKIQDSARSETVSHMIGSEILLRGASHTYQAQHQQQQVTPNFSTPSTFQIKQHEETKYPPTDSFRQPKMSTSKGYSNFIENQTLSEPSENKFTFGNSTQGLPMSSPGNMLKSFGGTGMPGAQPSGSSVFGSHVPVNSFGYNVSKNKTQTASDLANPNIRGASGIPQQKVNRKFGFIESETFSDVASTKASSVVQDFVSEQSANIFGSKAIDSATKSLIAAATTPTTSNPDHMTTSFQTPRTVKKKGVNRGKFI